MKKIENIEKSLDKIYEGFMLFNKRIEEFTNSTDSNYLDLNLIEKYKKTAIEFRDLLKKHKTETEKLKSKKSEYKANLELVIFRISNYLKLFENTINKLELITNSFNLQKKGKKDLKKYDFSSHEEMLKINKSLYKFYNIYNENLDFQNKFLLKLNLDDEFEKSIENSLKSLDLIEKEIFYVEDLNKLFYDLAYLERLFGENYDFCIKEKEEFCKNLRKEKSYFKKEFEKTFDKNYTFSDFKVKNTKFYRDFLNFYEKILKIISNFEILKKSINFTKKFEFLQKTNKESKILEKIIFLGNYYEFFLDFFGKDFYKSDEISLYLKENLDLDILDELINYADKIYNFFEKYKSLQKNIGYYGFGNYNLFERFFDKDDENNFLENGVKNLLENLISEQEKIIEKNIKNKQKILFLKELFGKYISKMDIIDNYLSIISSYLRKVGYSPYKRESFYLKTLNSYADKIGENFGGNFSTENLKDILAKELSKKFAKSKRIYEINKRNNEFLNIVWDGIVSNSSSTGFSSGGGGGFSSTWSSGGGSFSSGYSSSGGSSW